MAFSLGVRLQAVRGFAFRLQPVRSPCRLKAELQTGCGQTFFPVRGNECGKSRGTGRPRTSRDLGGERVRSGRGDFFCESNIFANTFLILLNRFPEVMYLDQGRDGSVGSHKHLALRVAGGIPPGEANDADLLRGGLI